MRIDCSARPVRVSRRAKIGANGFAASTVRPHSPHRGEPLTHHNAPRLATALVAHVQNHLLWAELQERWNDTLAVGALYGRAILRISGFMHLLQSVRATHRVLTVILTFDFVVRIALRRGDKLTVTPYPSNSSNEAACNQPVRGVPSDAVAGFQSMRHELRSGG